MARQRFFIWTGGGPGDPESGPRADALPELPAPDPLPRAAVITYWWGETRFEIVASAGSVRTTPWGAGRMTWLHCKAVQAGEIKPSGPTGQTTVLVPAQYVTAVVPGPPYQITRRGESADIGLFPPIHPTPPKALLPDEIERALAGLADAPADAGWTPFSVAYPVFALKLDGGGFLGFDGPAPGPGGAPRTTHAIPVFTAEAWAVAFLRRVGTPARVEAFDRAAAFRRFLRPIRDAGTYVLFDPEVDARGRVRADHTYPAAVVLERFLPPVRWGWSYPVYLLRRGPGFVSVGGHHEGRRVELLPVFTDADLAARAVLLAPGPTSAFPIPDREAFGRLIRALPAGVWGAVFDPPDPVHGGLATTAIARERLLADLADLEL